jgi:hypothetical protein
MVDFCGDSRIPSSRFVARCRRTPRSTASVSSLYIARVGRQNATSPRPSSLHRLFYLHFPALRVFYYANKSCVGRSKTWIRGHLWPTSVTETRSHLVLLWRFGDSGHPWTTWINSRCSMLTYSVTTYYKVATSKYDLYFFISSRAVHYFNRHWNLHLEFGLALICYTTQSFVQLL